MAYSIPVRVAGLITRPLSILSSPTHPLSRFQYVQQPPYIPPPWYPGYTPPIPEPPGTVEGQFDLTDRYGLQIVDRTESQIVSQRPFPGPADLLDRLGDSIVDRTGTQLVNQRPWLGPTDVVMRAGYQVISRTGVQIVNQRP